MEVPMNRPRIDFTRIKEEVTITKVAQMLNLALKREADGFRCACVPDGNPRALKITPGHRNNDGTLGTFYCHECSEGGDLIALCAHIQRVNNYEAASYIAKHFGIGTAPHRAPSPARKPEPEGRREGLKRLDYLVFQHEVIEMLGISPATCEAIGIGYASKGVMAGRIAIPLLLPDGTLVGYFGIATKPDQVPFPDNLDEKCGVKPVLETEEVEEQSPNDLRKMFRVEGGK
jgi:hypothetical protein